MAFWHSNRCPNCDKRTKAHDDAGRCWEHAMKAMAASERSYDCPLHQKPMDKEICDEGIILDRCSEGCVFMDPDEIDTLIEAAQSSGQNNGLAMGVAVGVAT